MVKAKPLGKTDALPKLPLKSLKQSAIHKKKNPKFKNTPTGKVNLINGSKMQNNYSMKPQKQFLKGKNASPEKSPKQQGGNKVSPQAKNIGSNKKGQPPQSTNGKKRIVKDLVPKDEESESDEDYNEGIVIQEEISMLGEDDIDDEDDSDDDVPDIFGTSLADDTDEDDEDFDEEDSVEDEEGKDNSPQKKGIKMFAGVKSKGEDVDKSDDSSMTLNTSASSVQNSSFMTNDDYDEEEDEDDEDNEDSEDTEDEDDEDSEDEDEDDSEDEEEEEEEESGPGLKALLGNSLADDDDDEDFDGEEEDSEDEDISDEEDDDEANNSIGKTTEKKQQESLPFVHEKHNEKTIFVGNLPAGTKKEQLLKLFKKFGPIQAVRLRGIIPIEENMPKKVAAITKKIHPKVKTIYAYVIFVKEESAKAALALNGELFEGNYLRVDGTTKNADANVNPKKSVFLGNLAFKADNNAIWEHFKDCGEIESVRIIKHNKTGVGKGIGYINFKHEDSVALALKLDGTQLVGREVRVKPYATHDPNAKKPKHEGKKRPLPQESSNQPKKMKASLETSEQHKGKSQKKRGQDSDDKQTSPQNKGTFQGQKVDLKKKKKPNKQEKQKKIMAAKLTAKSKKPAAH